MSRKLEIRSRMAEVQKEFSALSAEIKEMDKLERTQRQLETYKDYVHKVFVCGAMPDEPKWEEVSDDDRRAAYLGENSGYVFSGEFTEGAYLLLKTREEYPRIKTLFDRIYAVKALGNKEETDKEKQIRIILGENNV